MFMRTGLFLLCIALLLGSCFAVNLGQDQPEERGSYPVLEYRAQPVLEKLRIGFSLTVPTLYANREGYYCYRFDGLEAAELRSVLTATVYEGNTPVSNSLTHSPDTYGNGKTGTWGTLCKALVAYSDSAKVYFLS